MTDRICSKDFFAEFNCKTRSWILDVDISTGGSCSTTGPNANHWTLTEECKAKYTKSCPDDECLNTGPPSPPDFEPPECCVRCIWIFYKEFDCKTLTWQCVDAVKECREPIGVLNDWVIDGCSAKFELDTEILCRNVVDCPTPICEQSPGGPFVIQKECC